MKKLKAPRLITIAILTLITVVSWTFFSVYRVLTSKPAPTIPKEVLEPLTPTLDQKTLDQMLQGIFFEKGEAAQP